jgi:glycine/D-amino acid oxidase-like deaminating enzyme
MSTRYGTSPWIDGFPRKRRPDHPRFRGPQTFPVAIIGGGLSGCFTAYAFAAAGVKVALLEADRLGSGGAGRGPGVLRAEAAPSFRDIEERHGLKAARALFEGSRRAVLDLIATARRLGAVKGIESGDAVRVLGPYGDDKPLMREAAARRDAGLDVSWLKAAAATKAAGVESARAAVRLSDWGSADPYDLLVRFAAAAAERGAVFFERSAVRRLRIRSKHVELHTAGGILTAETVIICTGEPTSLHASLKRHVHGEETYAVMTERLPAAMRRSLQVKAAVITDVESPPHLVRWTSDGRLIVSGGDQPRPPARGADKVLVQRTGQLMYELSRMYPAMSGILPAYGWQVPTATTADGAMYAGPHRNFPRHLFLWATRHDPAQAFLGSRVLLRHYLGDPHRDDKYFAFTRG